MKTRLLLVLSSLVGPGCAGGTDPGPFPTDLTEAAAVWARDKPACARYHYLRSSESWTGSKSETAVEITNDRPTRRRFRAQWVQDDGQVKTEQWDETGAAIGGHDGAYRAQTVEELFADCRAAVGQDPTANVITLRIGAHGVPADCTFRPKECVDDCLMGVRLSDFACGPLP